MKRMLAILLSLTLTLGTLTACGKSAATAGSAATAESAQSKADSAAPTEEPEEEQFPVDPLTGEDTEQNGDRPVAVMLQNGYEALPQWGVSQAEVMIEGLTSGDTTSLMALYSCVDEMPKVGPVGQGEDLFLQFALPLNAIPVHIGTTVYASNLLNLLTYQDLNGTYIGTTVFDIEKDRYNSGANDEYCWYTTEELMENGLDYYGEDKAGDLRCLFNFAEKDLDAANKDGKGVVIHYSDNCEVGLYYNENNDAYYRDNGNGESMVDGEDDEAVSFENVFVLYAPTGCKDNYYTRDYDLDEGVGLYLSHGGYRQIVWQKGSATAPLKVYDLEGNELQVSPGTSYIGIYGGVGAQFVRVTDADGEEQELPENPEPMDSYGTYIEACDTVKAQSDEINAQLAAAAEAAAAEGEGDDEGESDGEGEDAPAEEEAPAEEAPAEEAPAEENPDAQPVIG